MSSKDDKSDLSNLKSRLGLDKSKSGGDSKDKKSSKSQRSTEDQSGSETESKAGSGGSSKGEAAKKKSGGVEDRLSALKESTLKKQKKEQPEPEAPATGGETDPVSDQPGTSSGGAPAPGGGGQRPGPPPGAQGPPPTAMGPSSQQQPTASTTTSSSTSTDGEEADVDLDDEDIDLSEIGIDDDSIFSKPVIGVLIVLLVVGVIFGFLAAESFQSRDIEQASIDDSARLLDGMEDQFADFAEVREIAEGLEPTEIDFEAAEEMAALDFAVDARVLPHNRILLGEEIVRPLNRYMSQSNILSSLIADHQRLTTGADREELEAYQEELDEIGEGEQVAAIFDLLTLRRHMAAVAQEEADPGDYIPPRARLVRIPDDFEELEPDDDGMVEVHVLASDAPDTVDIQALVPILDSDFLDVDPGNALDRYSQRVEEIQHYVDELGSTAELLEEELESAATADPPPLLTLAAGDDPAEEYMEDEPPEPDELVEDEPEDDE